MMFFIVNKNNDEFVNRRWWWDPRRSLHTSVNLLVTSNGYLNFANLFFAYLHKWSCAAQKCKQNRNWKYAHNFTRCIQWSVWKVFLFPTCRWIFLKNINDLQKFDSLNKRIYDLMFIVMFARSYQLVFLSINHCVADISPEF